MKPCIRCGEVKPLDDFYRHARMADGRLNKCIACVKEYERQRRLSILSTPEGLQAERARGRDKYWRLYRGVKRVRNPVTTRQWIERNPEKRAAHTAVGNALRSGKLVRQPCETCGDPQVDAHHEDYSQPLSVRWLCKKHHLELHRKVA